MSAEPILEYWPEGILAARIPANNNVRLLQALKINPAISATTAAQPGSPAEGDVYILPAAPTGAMWDSFSEDDVVIFYEATWTAYSPVDGLRKYVQDEGEDWQFTGDSSGGWAAAGGGGGGAVDSVNGQTGAVVLDATDVGAVATVNGDTGAVIVQVPIGVACSDESTALTTGAAKVTFRIPFAMTVTAVRANLKTAQTSGSTFTVDINEAGASILSTKITIDNTEKTSVTAANPPVISDSSLADDAEITVDIDQVGDGTAIGLKVWLIGYPA